MGGTALRKCLGCFIRFLSMSPAERFCGPCRKKRKGKMRYGVHGDPISTPEIDQHLHHIDMYGTTPFRDPVDVLNEAALAFLDDSKNKNFDDTPIYDELAREEYMLRMMEDKPAGKVGRPGGSRKGFFKRSVKVVEKVVAAIMEESVYVEPKGRKTSKPDWCLF